MFYKKLDTHTDEPILIIFPPQSFSLNINHCPSQPSLPPPPYSIHQTAQVYIVQKVKVKKEHKQGGAELSLRCAKLRPA